MPSIVTITEENFKQEIYETRDVILLDLWAPWCAPCKTLSPIIDKLAALPSENLIVAKLDVEQYPEMMRRLGLRGIPALLVFKDGQEIARELGTKTLYQLKEWLTPYGVQFTESSAPAVDTPSFDAFYGDLQLKQFLFDRLKTHAQRAELQASPEPFWENGVGTPSAAMVHAADPVIFERITGLPTALAWALDFVGPYRPEDIQQLSDHLKL
ncbi:thioredoxin domain-containing protein, partial [Pseudomonas helleri]|uniref:thioredoxin domain-containing protein n=1 Tax=Pseudomonas helleri TaxID=1608996 RepID=UPI003FD1A17E